VEKPLEQRAFDSSLNLVRSQIQAYARLYERTRQRMPASDERTERLEGVFSRMREIATASYPLLGELADSLTPGEKLAAVSILQVFASEKHLPFLVRLVASERPFVGFHAIKALGLAVDALEPRSYPLLTQALKDARAALVKRSIKPDSDRLKLLDLADERLKVAVEFLTQGQIARD